MKEAHRCPQNVAKVVDSEGQLKLVRLPTTVAQLMTEHPGFAPSLVEDIRETHSLRPMKMNQMLVAQKLYLLVPIEKLHYC